MLLHQYPDVYPGNSYQELLIYDTEDRLTFTVRAESGQRGQFIILPVCGFDKIRYDIRRVGGYQTDVVIGEEEEVLNEGEGEV